LELGSNELAFRPLFQHVRESFIARLADGRWRPGMMLPSEQQLATELRVGQGTVRKALDALALENVLVRKQGKGTFVAFPEEGRLHFQFYRIRPDTGEYLPPENTVRSIRKIRADAETTQKLGLADDGEVWQIDRTKRLDGKIVSIDRIRVSAAKVPELEQVHNNLYVMYAVQFGQIVTSATERLKSLNASREDAELLGCREGDAILTIDRVASGLDGAPIEWRVSHCLTENFHYLSELR